MKTKVLLLPLLATSAACSLHAAERKPNVVFIIADDIGYGDFGCYGAKLIKTPNVDQLAAKGVRFSNAYSPASTSSPTRYSLLTGEYAWRKGVGILPGDAAMSIDTDEIALPKMMHSAGYKSGIVGKWHLGMGDGKAAVDFNKRVKNGMRAVGFDYSFIFPATNDRVPTIYMENDRTVGLDKKDPIEVNYQEKIGDDPTGKENPNLLRLLHYQGHDGTIVNGVGRIGWMSGGHQARWRDEALSEDLLSKAQEFITENSSKPFFLYYATHTAHEPRVASPKFKGVSQAGLYGDVIEEFDYCVGEVVKTLEEQGVLDNTIIVVTSDNGPMVKEGYLDGALEHIGEHDPYAGLRGAKYSLYEGGSRVPFILYWPSQVKESFVQNQRFCYIDMMATLSEIVDEPLTQEESRDSRSAKELFVDPNAEAYRPYILTQNNPGQFTLRDGDWKYTPAYGKWGAQLFDLSTDPSERHNLAAKEELKDIIARFEGYISELKAAKH
ncbi:MAG: arylsulfatase [Rikenellaceae bacterium]